MLSRRSSQAGDPVNLKYYDCACSLKVDPILAAKTGSLQKLATREFPTDSYEQVQRIDFKAETYNNEAQKAAFNISLRAEIAQVEEVPLESSRLFVKMMQR